MSAAVDTEVPVEVANALVDPQAHASHRIHDACRWLRAHDPLVMVEPEGFDPFWIVSKYEYIKWFALQNDLFHSGDRNITLTSKAEAKRMRELTGRMSYHRNLVNMDPPDHPKYRALAENYFTRASISKLEGDIRLIAKEFAGRLAAFDGECDFAQQIAFIYPLRVIMSLLGAPASDEDYLLTLTKQLMGVADPAQARGGRQLTGAEIADAFMRVDADFDAYFSDLLAERRARPRDDFASIIANARIDGKPLPALEAINYCKVVASAGHDTTAASTAGGVWALCDNPGEFARLQADPALTAGFIGEAIRCTSPSKLTMRSATRDAEYQGRQIKAGDYIGLAWVSANRDEEVFEDAFTFNINRSPFKPLSFGWGPHNCIGQHLARTEMRVLFEELLPRVKKFELAGEPKTLASLMVSGPRALPIRFQLN
jgi:cytochrome P450